MWVGALRVAGLATLLLAASSEAAEDAEAMLRRARGLFARAEFSASARLLERARKLPAEPALLARIALQLGVCREVLGELDDARSAFRAALEQDPELELEPTRHRESALTLFRSTREGLRGVLSVACEDGPGRASLDGAPLGALPARREVRVGAHRVELYGHDGVLVWSGKVIVRLDRPLSVAHRCPQPPPRLSVVTTPPGAEVLLDGVRIGRTPLRARVVAAGKHRLRLRRAGARDQLVELEAVAGSALKVERRLELLPPSPPPPPVAPAPRRRVWTWILGGAAAASLAAALGAGLASRGDYSAWEGEWERGSDLARWNELRDSGERKQLAANVLIGVGAALAAAATVLYFREGRSRCSRGGGR